MEIIILFAIIGIIGSVLKNAAKMQQPPPVVYRKPFQETTSDPESLEGISVESFDTQRKRRDEMNPVADPYIVSEASISGDANDAFLSSLEEADPLQVISLDDAQKRHHNLDLSENGVLNAIVLSEVFGKPKALRK